MLPAVLSARLLQTRFFSPVASVGGSSSPLWPEELSHESSITQRSRSESLLGWSSPVETPTGPEGGSDGLGMVTSTHGGSVVVEIISGDHNSTSRLIHSQV